MFLQLLAKEIACGGPKEVEGEGSRVWWRLKVEGPKKVNVCVVLEHLQLLSKRNGLRCGAVAGRGVEFRTSPEGLDVIPLRQTGCWLCGNSYARDGGESSTVHAFCPNKKLVYKVGGVSGTLV